MTRTTEKEPNRPDLPGTLQEKKQREWTPGYAAKVLFHTFRFAQGQGLPHTNIFQYLHILRPTWKLEMDTEFTNKVIALTTEAAEWFILEPGKKTEEPKNRFQRLIETPYKFVQQLQKLKEQTAYQRHTYYARDNSSNTSRAIFEIDQKIIKSDVITRAKDMSEQFDGNPLDRDKVLWWLLENFIERDENFLKRSHGRPRAGLEEDGPTGLARWLRFLRSKGSKADFDPTIHPWSSFLIDFGYRKADTEVSEIDEMFVDVTAFLEEQRKEGSERWEKIEPRFQKIIDVYNDHHSDNKFVLPVIA